MPQRISILGAGASGFALAADLESRGIQTLVYSHPDHLRNVHEIVNRGSLLPDYIPRITTNIKEAVQFSAFAAITVPSSGQDTILAELQPFDLRSHTFIALPGNLVSLLAPELNILETNLSPYSCRINDGELIILGRKKLFYIAGPHNKSIDALFDVRWCTNILEVCLSNINGVFHPIMMILNAGRIGTDFLLYKDGLTRPVANAMEQIDRTRLQIGAAFGFKLKSVIEVSNECYGQKFTDLVDLARCSPPHNKLKAPSDIEHRNISEDIPDLLVCWHDLAVNLGIDASPIKATIVMAEMMTGKQYSRTGRNLARLGLANLSKEQLLNKFSARSVITMEQRTEKDVEVTIEPVPIIDTVIGIDLTLPTAQEVVHVR